MTRAIVAFDFDGDALTYSAAGLPTGLGINAATGIISGTVASDAAATYNVTVAASDSALRTAVEFSWIVSAPGALAVDQVVFADAFGSMVTTPPFSTSVAGETLIAFATAAQPTRTGVQTALVTGGGLSWTLVTRANTQAGTAEIWQATASGLLSDITVSATVEIGGDPLTLTVVTFAGAAGVGASAAANDVTGAPLVSLTTTTAGSFVYGAGNDWDQGVARTPAPDQEIVHEYVTNTADTYWVQRYVGPVAAAGTVVQLNDTDPTTDRWNFAAVEIVPQPVVAPSVTASPTLAVAGTTITVTVANGPGHTTDLVGLFAVDADNSDFQAWEYLNGSQTPPASGLTSATLNFVAPTAPGLYNFRLFAAGNSTTPVATSNSVLVPSSLTINNVSIVEGNSGTTNAVFTVTLTPASPVSVTVDYATADGSATAGSDYLATTGTVTFPAGTTTQMIAVAVNGDTTIEPDETFFVNLSDATNAVIGAGRGKATIMNDDFPALKISDVTVVEGNSGTTNAVFTVTLTPASPVSVTVKYATANGTATAGSDYVATTGTLTFPAGTTTRTITVSVLGDTAVEPDETFVVNLSGATNATIADAQGVGTIANDDTAATLEGRMFGFGGVDEGHTRNRFLFRVSERNTRDYGRLEFWSTDDRNDDDDDGDCDGDHDRDYGRNHHNVRLRFESTAISSVTFSDDPAFTPGSGRRQPTVDSVVFAGAGKWNGKSGYTFEVRATDQGEPGRNRDTFSLVVKDSRGTIVASVSGKIDSGNIQSTRLAR